MLASNSSLYSFVLFAEAAAKPEGPSSLLVGPLLPMLVVGILFYLMILRPERTKRNDHTELVSNLKKNDRIVTIGGIFGTVVNAQKDSEEVVVKVDESANTKLRILRSAISRVITAENADQK
jgi:preprotein translocase subunit YajC